MGFELIAKSKKFDVAILDWNLSNDSTRRLADQLIAENVPVLFSTAFPLPSPYTGLSALKKTYSASDLQCVLTNLENEPDLPAKIEPPKITETSCGPDRHERNT